MIRLHLVSLISPLPPYGFRTNLVPTERSFRGKSNAVGCKKFGEELAEDIEYYREMSRLAQKGYWCFHIPDDRSLDFLPTRQVFSLNSHSFLAGFGVFWRLERVFY